MRVISLLLALVFLIPQGHTVVRRGATVADVDRSLNVEIQNYRRFEAQIYEHCVQNPNAATYTVMVNNRQTNCRDLIRAKEHFQQRIETELEQIQAQCDASPGNQNLQQQAADHLRIAQQAGLCRRASNDSQCWGQGLCAMAAAVTSFTIPMLPALLDAATGSRNQCIHSGNNCMQQIFSGILHDMWGTLTSIWEGLGWVAGKIGQGARWVGHQAYDAGHRALEYFGVVRAQERHTSNRGMMAQRASPSFISEFTAHPWLTLQNVARSVFNGLKQAAMQTYGCEEWTAPNGRKIDGIAGMAIRGASCTRPMTNWDCATCNQKMQVWCGIGGMAIGEIITAVFTGGAVAAGRAIAVGASRAVMAAARVARVDGAILRAGQVASRAVSVIPRGARFLAEASTAALRATGVPRVLSAAERAAVASWARIQRSPISRAIAQADRNFNATRLGRGTAIATRAIAHYNPVSVYLHALEEAPKLGYQAVDGAIARATGRATGAAEAAAHGAEAARASETRDRASASTSGIEDRALVIEPPPPPRAQRDQVREPLLQTADKAESSMTARDVLETGNRTESGAGVSDIGSGDLNRTLGAVDPSGTVERIILQDLERSPQNPLRSNVVPTAPEQTQGGALVVSSERSDAQVVEAANNGSRTESSTSRASELAPESARRAPASTTRIPSATSDARTATAEARTSATTTEGLSTASRGSLSEAGLSTDTLVRPPSTVARADREIAFTLQDLEGRFSRWRQEGVYDDIFSTLRGLSSENEKKRFLAILLNAPEGQVRETLLRLRSFRNATTSAARETYFGNMERRINTLGDELNATLRLPDSAEKTANLSRIRHERSALLQEKTLLQFGDNVEIRNIFSSRASNQAYLDKGYQPHSLDDTFSVDLKVRSDGNVSVCRGSFAGAATSSFLTGGFTTICRDGNYQTRNAIGQFVAAPDDASRVGRANSGYDRFNRFGLRKNDEITLGLNGPVAYVDDAQRGSGGVGGGVELFTYRSQTNPVTLDRLEGSVRIPTCDRAECQQIFSVQERLRPGNLANQSDVPRYLQHQQREANGIINGLNPRIDTFVRNLPASDAQALDQLANEFSDVRSALNLRREVELKSAPGFNPLSNTALDAEATALRDATARAQNFRQDFIPTLNGRNSLTEIRNAYRDAIESSPLVRTHLENEQFIHNGLERLRSGTLSTTERNELLYQISVRQGQEEDFALAIQTLRRNAMSSTSVVPGITEAQKSTLNSFVSDLFNDVRTNGLERGRVAEDLSRASRITTSAERTQEAERVLGHPITSATQRNALEAAHNVGAGTGRGFNTYTREEIVQKGNILRNAGFSSTEIRTLMERGITGSPTSGNVLDRMLSATTEVYTRERPQFIPRTPAAPAAPASASTDIWTTAAREAEAEAERRRAANLWGRIGEETRAPAPRTEVPRVETPRVETPRPAERPSLTVTTETDSARVARPEPAPPAPARATVAEASPRPARAPAETPRAPEAPRASTTELPSRERAQFRSEQNARYSGLSDQDLFFRNRGIETDRLAARQRVIDEYDNRLWRSRENELREQMRNGGAWYTEEALQRERQKITSLPEEQKLAAMSDTERARLAEIDQKAGIEREAYEAERSRRAEVRRQEIAARPARTPEEVRTQYLERQNWVVPDRERDLLAYRRGEGGRINATGARTESELMDSAQLSAARASGVPENRAGYITLRPSYSPQDAEAAFGRLFEGQTNAPNIRYAHSILTMEPQTAARIMPERMSDARAVLDRLRSATPEELRGISPEIRRYYQDRLEVYVCVERPASCMPRADARITPELQRMAALNDTERTAEANRVLNRTLTATQEQAVIRAHNVGAGSGRGFFTYTEAEIREKGLILRNAGFSAPEIRTLIERGITGEMPRIESAIAETEFQRLLRTPGEARATEAAAAPLSRRQLERRAELSSARYDELRASSRSPQEIYDARQLRDRDARDLATLREREVAAAQTRQQESGRQILEGLMDRPVNIDRSASSVTTTPTLLNDLSPAKRQQIEAAYANNPLDVIVNAPQRGDRVEWLGEGNRVGSGRLQGVDPANRENFLIMMDNNGVEQTISRPQTAVAATPNERAALWRSPEVSAQNTRDFENLLNRTETRAPAAVTPEAQGQALADHIVRRALGNPNQSEIDRISAQLSRMTMDDPEYFSLQQRMTELARPFSPLTREEQRIFDIIAEIPADRVRYSPQEWAAIQEAQRIRASRAQTFNLPEFDRLFEMTNQRSRMEAIVQRMDLENGRANPRAFGAPQRAMPPEIETQLRAIPNSQSFVESAQRLLRLKPSEIIQGNNVSDLAAVKSFLERPANAGLVRDNPALQYVKERTRRYDIARQAEDELGKPNPGIPDRLDYSLAGRPAPVSGDPRITLDLRRAAGLNDSQRTIEAARVINRPLTEAQSAAVLRSHNVGAGTGRGFLTYTPAEIREKGLILKNAGFSAPEIRQLMERGITGDLPEASRTVAGSSVRTVESERAPSPVVSSGNADRLADRMDNLTESPSNAPLVGNLLTEYRSERQAAADGFRALNTSADTTRALNNYAQAGNTSRAVEMMERSATTFRRPAEDILRANQSRMNELAGQIRSASASGRFPAAEVELQTLREANETFARARGLERPTALLPTPWEVNRTSPQAALTRAETLRASGRNDEAALFYLRGSANSSFSDPNFRRAISTSLSGSGTLAREHYQNLLNSGGSAVSGYVDSLYANQSFRSLTPPQKRNLSLILTDIRDRGILPAGNSTYQRNLGIMLEEVGAPAPNPIRAPALMSPSRNAPTPYQQIRQGTSGVPPSTSRNTRPLPEPRTSTNPTRNSTATSEANMYRDTNAFRRATNANGGREITVTVADSSQATELAMRFPAFRDMGFGLPGRTWSAYNSRLERSSLFGQRVGWQISNEKGFARVRLDWDPQKGAHYNIEIVERTSSGNVNRKLAISFPCNGRPCTEQEVRRMVDRIQ